MESNTVRGAEYAQLAAFMAVAKERSFRRAARQLGLSPSALSRTIRSLEERLGARLLNRTTRSVAPTQAGDALFKRLDPMVAEMDRAVREVGTDVSHPKGTVRLNLPRIAARLVIAPMLTDFSVAYPDIRLDLVVDDSVTDIVAEGFDLGVRSGTLVQKDMVAVPLTTDLRMAVVGSPSYFEGRSPPRVPADLRHHNCVTYRWSETRALYRWSFDGRDGPLEVVVDSVMTANDTDLLLTAALAGLGLAFLPETFVATHIEHGTLLRVLDEWTTPFAGFHLYYPSRIQMPPAVRAFVDFLKRSGPLARSQRDEHPVRTSFDPS